MLPRDPRTALRWRLLHRLPLKLLLLFDTGWAFRKRLDYPAAEIYLHIRSRAEAQHLHSCSREPWTIEWIEQHLQPGDVLYDVGANVGAYSLVAAQRGRGQVRVVAIEPRSWAFASLCENIILNTCGQLITPLPIALAEQTGLATYGASDATELLATVPGLYGMPLPQQKRAVGQVPAMTLDDLIGRFELPLPSHLRLALPGLALAALRGATITLRAPTLRSILVSTTPSEGSLVEELLATWDFTAQPRSAVRNDAAGVTEVILFHRPKPLPEVDYNTHTSDLGQAAR